MATAKRKVTTNNLKVLDENSLVEEEVTAINFVGTSVKALSPITGKVNIYIPTPEFVSNFNQGDAYVANVGTLRHIPSPTSEGTPYSIGDWTSGTNHITINTNPTWTTNSECSINNLLNTSITIEVKNIDDSGSLIEDFTHIITEEITTGTNIELTISDLTADSIKYKANISVTLDIETLLPSGGRFYVKILHDDSVDGTYQKTQTIFYDPASVTATVSSLSISENTITGKHLSGIFYATSGDTFDIEINDIDYINDRSYPNNLITVDTYTDYGIPNLTLTSSDLTNWTNIYDVTGVSYTGTNIAIDTGSNCFRTISTSVQIESTLHDWVDVTSVQSTAKKYLIDTCAPVSDQLNEYFTDENFRLKSDYSTVWDSTENLTAYDDNRGLMVQDGLLQIPENNWVVYGPGYGTNPDYSSIPSGNKSFYRNFTDINSNVRTNVTFNFTLDPDTPNNILYYLENSIIEIWINIPGRFTGSCFLHGTDTFNAPDFNADPDNKSLRLDSSTANTIYASFGNYGLTSSQNFFNFLLYIHTDNPEIKISSISVSW